MTLRSVVELAGSEEGRALLEERGIHTDAERFRAALRPPRRPQLMTELGLPPDRRLVYVGQQVAADYAHATAAKFAATRQVAGPGVECMALWHDMDRAGSDRYGLRIVLHLGGKRGGVWLAPRELEDREPRFIPAQRERLEELVRRARNATDGLSRATRARARERLDRLAAGLREEDPQTMADAGLVLTTHLLREQLGVRLPGRFISEVAGAGLLRDTLVQVLATLDEVVEVFNTAVQELRREGIDPQVRLLDGGYLPLWYSCPVTGQRLRLFREQDGRERFGVASCPCGQRHRFHLGDGAPSLDELERTRRWSPDVLLPALHDDLASGYVAGRSTALYGMVLRAVLRGPLGREPTPAFLPPELAAAGGPPPEPDSLLHSYLVG